MRLNEKYQVLLILLSVLLSITNPYFLTIISVSNLVKKTDYNTKVNEVNKKITDHNHDNYITTPEFNKLTAKNFAARLAQANLETKTDFENKLINFHKKLTQIKQNIY